MIIITIIIREEREKGSLSDFGIELKLQRNNLHTAAASYSKVHCKSERSVLAVKMWPFRWVKYSPIFESNLAPLIRANTVQLPKTDLDPRAETCPGVGWNRLLMGLLWLKLCSNGSKRAWIRLRSAGLNWHFGAEADLFNFQCERAINLCLV